MKQNFIIFYAVNRKIKICLNFVLCLSLIFSQTVFAKNKVVKNNAVKQGFQRRSFNPNDVKRLNQLSNSHQLARSYLKIKDAHPDLVLESKKLLEQKAFKISKVKLKDSKLIFKYKAKDYMIEYIQDGKYKIGSDIIDFNQKDLGASKIKFKTSRNVINYIIPQADAFLPAIPMGIWYFGGILLGVVVASGCLNISVTSFFGKDAVPDAKFLDNTFIAREFRNLRRKLKLEDVGCSANAESIIDENLDADSVFKQACAIKKQGKNPMEEFTDSPEKYEFRACFDDSCSKPLGQIYFNQLDELNRNMLQGFIEDENFMSRICQPRSSGTNNPYLSPAETQGVD